MVGWQKSTDIAVDLGTANTIVSVDGEVIFNGPSCIAIERHYGSDKVVAIGKRAKVMRGRTHSNLEVINPLSNGAISDFEVTKIFMATLISILSNRVSSHPRVGISIPQNLTQVERNSLYEATLLAGAKEVIFIEDPFSAAVGTGMDINTSRGKMIVDCGSGLTEVSIISLGGMVTSSCTKVAGDALDCAIVDYVKRQKNLLISKDCAEGIKIQIADISQNAPNTNCCVYGKDLLNGLPVGFEISSTDVRAAIMPCVQKIHATILEVISSIPPQIVPDILEDGVIITGGGALMRGFREYLEDKLKMSIHVSPDPLHDISRGAMEILKQIPHSSFIG